RDGHDTLAWIARQSWSNGKIGTWGGSALGITQTLMSPGAPDALQAQFIRWGTSNFYAQAVHQGGAFRKVLIEGWLKSIKADPETLEAYIANYTYSPFWDGMNSEAHAHEVNTPGVYWGGWYDIFCQGTINAFAAGHNRGGPRARGKCRLIMGPWAHGKLVEIQYPKNSKAPPGVKSLDAMAFFDHHLKGADNGVAADTPVHYYVMGDPTDPKAPGNFWRAADNWPPPANPVKFYFHGDKKLVRGVKQTGNAQLAYKYDPKNPVPTIGGQNMIIDRGPMDQRRIESREDVLVFTTDVLDEPLEVTGRISSKLYIESDCPDTDFTVKLCDVYPDGRSMIVTDGILRARFRMSFEKEELIEPGKTYELTVDLSSTSLIFNKGHRIRVAISSSNAPRFDPNPNTGKPLRADDATRIATNTVHMSAAHPSCVVLPIYAGTKGNGN
ncbi:MAG: CocE/NonD family hydrolase, partial [Planctomycetes bacterium]|nr:CocE/NonD family hydrolase [Planctomycetota bacterium]